MPAASRRHERKRPSLVTPMKRPWWRLAVIVAAVAATYWNSLGNAFVGDDASAIAGNAEIRQWWNLARVLFPPRDSAVAGRPLVNASLAFNYALGGLHPAGYHLVNIGLHAACALLLFALARRTLQWLGEDSTIGRRAMDVAFAGALVWAVHPLNSEVVDYTVQRTESMMAFFYLLTVYCSVRSAERPRAVAWQGAAVLSCALGALCKESIATVPVVILLYGRVFLFPSVRDAFHKRWPLYAGLSATWLLTALLMASGPRVDAVGLQTGVSPMTYLFNQAIMICRYLRLAVWPTSLVALYGWPQGLTFGDVAPQLALVAALLFAAMAMLYLRPQIGFLGAWFFITLAPASSVIPVATEVGAERRMYLPLIAVVMLIVVAAARTLDAVAARSTAGERGGGRVGRFILLGAVCLLLAAATHARNREYESNLPLARTAVERWPSAVGHGILGEELLAAGARDEGIEQLREAVKGNSKAHFSLGLALFGGGKIDEARQELEAFVQTWHAPVRPVPHWQEPTPGELITARTMLARIYAAGRQWARVEDQARQIFAVNPASVDARLLLADALLAEDRYDEATLNYRQYLASRPNDVAALISLGSALAARDQGAEAMGLVRRAVELEPRNVDARRSLAALLFDARDADQAAGQARAAIALQPRDAVSHDLLGRSLAVQGHVAEALDEFRRALELDPTYEQAREDLGRIERVGRGRTP